MTIFDTDNEGMVTLGVEGVADSTNLDGSKIVEHWIDPRCVAAIRALSPGEGVVVHIYGTDTVVRLFKMTVPRTIAALGLSGTGPSRK